MTDTQMTDAQVVDADRGDRAGERTRSQNRSSPEAVASIVVAEPKGERAHLAKRLEKWLKMGSPILLLLAWELLVRSTLLDSRFFPAPSTVAMSFWANAVDGNLFPQIGITMQRAALGLVAGTIPGILVGLTMGLIPFTRALLWPIVGALYPIPRLAILPLLMLIFGLGETSKVVFIGLGVFFPVLINTLAGVMSIPTIYHEVSSNFGASRVRSYTTVALPGALEMIVAGVRLGWGQALLLIVAAEFVASQNGMGYWIWESWQSFQVPRMYVGLVLISIIGYVSFQIIDFIAAKLVPWSH